MADRSETHSRFPDPVPPLDRFAAVLFDLDGVVTRTAAVHAAAWKRLFDAYLERRARRTGTPFAPFDADADYRRYVDGRPRADGTRAFLEARGIVDLPAGSPDDGPEAETIHGLGNRKNLLFREALASDGVAVYETVVELLRTLRARGVRTAVVSSSRNCRAVLDVAGIADLFDVRVDGVDLAEHGLPGKPDPALFLEAARRLGVPPGRAVVVEDAVAGVAAGRRGGFGLVVGVDRGDRASALAEAGADIVTGDPGLLVPGSPPGEATGAAAEEGRSRASSAVPSVWAAADDLRGRIAQGRPVVFLDYDGTLTPIVENPEAAEMTDAMRAAVDRLSRRCTVAVVSGRDLDRLRAFVRLPRLFYAGSHGFDIAGPEGSGIRHRTGEEFLTDLDTAEHSLATALAPVPGALVERKRFALAAHYRAVAEADVGRVEAAVAGIAAERPRLIVHTGKKVFELRPAIAWDKGRAVLFLLDRLGLDDRPGILPMYIGDDRTDEDAFRALRGRGIGILVRDGEARGTAADYALDGIDEVERFLDWLAATLARTPRDGGRT